MNSSRMEAFSDGVLAIIITIMVLEMQTPTEPSAAALIKLAPSILAYLLSYIYVAIYWNNHHCLLKKVDRVNPKILWNNMHLLFWLSMVPLATAWMSRFYTESIPVLTYGVVLMMSSISYWILQTQIVESSEKRELLKQLLGKDWKGKGTDLLYVVAVIASFPAPLLSEVCYVIAALLWFIPDRRMETLQKN